MRLTPAPTDAYTYDALGRLTAQTTTGAAARTLSFTYDKRGNLLSKLSNKNTAPYDLDASAYTYGNTSFPNRLTAFTLTSGAPASTTYQLVYDANQGNITQYEAPAGADHTYLNYDPLDFPTRSRETPGARCRFRRSRCCPLPRSSAALSDRSRRTRPVPSRRSDLCSHWRGPLTGAIVGPVNRA